MYIHMLQACKVETFDTFQTFIIITATLAEEHVVNIKKDNFMKSSRSWCPSVCLAGQAEIGDATVFEPRSGYEWKN